MGCGASKPPSGSSESADNRPGGKSGEPAAAHVPKRRNSYQAPEVSLPAHAGGGTNPFPGHLVGCYSNHGMKPGPTGRAAAKINQDRGLITYPLAADKSMCLLAVYDGHGANGEQVSEFCMLKVPDLLEEAGADRLWDDTENLLKQAFDKTDKLLHESPIASAVSGTTGVAVLLQGSKIWTACVGDSRAILGRRKPGGKQYSVCELTKDQKPDTPEEQARILATGGYVSPESPQFGPARVWLRPGEGPGLAMARSLGDHVCSRVGVIATPEVKSFETTADDALIVIASDGVWEFLENDEVIAIVSQHSTAQQGCIALIDESTKRWKREEGNYRDDITAIVVKLPLDCQSLSRGTLAEESIAAATGAQSEAERMRASNQESARAAAAQGAVHAAEPAADPPAGSEFQKRRLSVAVDVDEQKGLQMMLAETGVDAYGQ